MFLRELNTYYSRTYLGKHPRTERHKEIPVRKKEYGLTLHQLIILRRITWVNTAQQV